jgi:hypothetical protein
LCPFWDLKVSLSFAYITEQAEQDSQNRTGRTGQAEQDRQNRTGRTVQVELDRQNMTDRTG